MKIPNWIATGSLVVLGWLALKQGWWILPQLPMLSTVWVTLGGLLTGKAAVVDYKHYKDRKRLGG